MHKPTSHDVARLAGVSQPTVSRALRAETQVSAATRDRVRAAAKELGYVPSRRGRNLSTQTTGQVAIVVGALGNPFYTEAVEHLHARLTVADLRVVVVTDEPAIAPAADVLVDGSVDGVIVTTTTLGSTAPDELARHRLPVVLFNRVGPSADVDACVSDNVQGAALVAHELVRLGHRRIGAILGPAHTSTGRDREAGFRSALADLKRTLPAARVHRGPFTPETGDEGLGVLMARATPPTAIFCANDVIAFGALNAARRLGLAVPGDLTVIGFDDIRMAAWEVFRLTTVRQDLPAMADAAVRMLTTRIARPDLRPRRLTVPTQPVSRATHGPAPGGRAPRR